MGPDCDDTWPTLAVKTETLDITVDGTTYSMSIPFLTLNPAGFERADDPWPRDSLVDLTRRPSPAEVKAPKPKKDEQSSIDGEVPDYDTESSAVFLRASSLRKNVVKHLLR